VLRSSREENQEQNMQIRDAVEADLPAIVAIYNMAVPCQIVTADLEPVSVESRLHWFYEHTPGKRPLWVAEVRGEVVGWLGLQWFYSGRPAYHATAELSIYIDAAYQQQGIGQQLLEWAIQHCPSLGITTLLGFIFADNKPSLHLFEKFGFEQWGCLPRVAEFEQGKRDLVIVGRKV
jgi:phosphinothricin acetyltransferase